MINWLTKLRQSNGASVQRHTLNNEM